MYFLWNIDHISTIVEYKKLLLLKITDSNEKDDKNDTNLVKHL